MRAICDVTIIQIIDTHGSSVNLLIGLLQSECLGPCSRSIAESRLHHVIQSIFRVIFRSFLASQSSAGHTPGISHVRKATPDFVLVPRSQLPNYRALGTGGQRSSGFMIIRGTCIVKTTARKFQSVFELFITALFVLEFRFQLRYYKRISA